MIKLIKLDKPDILTENAEKWTKEYCDCLNKGEKPSNSIASRYNNKEIKKKLKEETNGKCAYCESKIQHITSGDIEHILPKNIDARPDLYVEWTNLTLACEKCNRIGKGTYYNPSKPLINPYVDDPENHFQVLGPMIIYKEGDDRAYITENKLMLNRPELIIQRSERIDAVKKLLFHWEKCKDKLVKDLLEDQLRKEFLAEKEYSVTIKHFLISRQFPV